ncbi:MAG: RluA family pseudouridine synthase, partial [Lachnospiraceae bacterium]
MKELRITDLEAGQRLDKYLDRYLSNAGSGFIYKMLRKKNIT